MASDEKATKAAHNQALFRSVNERIREISDGGAVPEPEPVGFLCECADVECAQTIDLTIVEYEAIRLVPTRFPVKPGHEWADVERVVEQTEHYYVVEKHGEAGRLAVQDWQEPGALRPG